MKKKLFSPKGILIVLAAVFLFWNLMWIIKICTQFLPYRDALNKHESAGVYILSHNGYTYSVKMPYYLSFTGNLAVVNNENESSLIVWPSLFGENEYGISIVAENEIGEKRTYEMFVDHTGKPIGENNNIDVQDIWKKYENEITAIFEDAKAVWGNF